MKTINIITIILLSQSALAYAPPTVASFPTSLLYHNQPLDALCIDEANKTTSLKNCGVNAKPNREISGHNTVLAAKGFIGYEYKDKPTDFVRGYSYYKVIGKSASGVIVYTVNSGGGSGEFTAVKLITRKGDTITVHTLSSGDRCNGGVSNAEINHDNLFYQVNLTPYDFLVLNSDNPLQLKAYDDLAACAVCCAGTATFARSLAHPTYHEKLVNVDFSHYSLDEGYNPNEQPYQRCFDKQIEKYKAQHKTILNAKEFNEFTQEFNAVCHLK